MLLDCCVLRRSALALALALCGPAVANTHEFAAGEIAILHPWTPVPPAGARVAAGYLTLKNRGADDRLLGAKSHIASDVAIHEMSVDADGVMRMRPVEGGLPLVAGSELLLQPGDYHLMFEALKRPLAEGDRFPSVLTFEKAGEVTVEFVVEKKKAGGGGHAAH